MLVSWWLTVLPFAGCLPSLDRSFRPTSGWFGCQGARVAHGNPGGVNAGRLGGVAWIRKIFIKTAPFLGCIYINVTMLR